MYVRAYIDLKYLFIFIKQTPLFDNSLNVFFCSMENVGNTIPYDIPINT